MRVLVLISLLAGCVSTGMAAPSITAAGARNGASQLLTVAPGSRIVFTGKNLGPSDPVSNEDYPLQTTLGDVSVRIAVGDSTIDAFVLRSSASSVVALLPSQTPLGTGKATLTYAGESTETTIQVVDRAIGLYVTSAAASSGIAVAKTEAGDAIGLNRSATPGQTVRLRATGLGAVSGDEASAPAQQSFDGDFEIRVGNAVATLTSAQRIDVAGIDEIAFTIPQNIEQGCFVPVAVKSAGRWSNFVNLPVASNGAACASGRFGDSDIDRIFSGNGSGEAKIGGITLSRSTISAEGAEIVSDNASGSFLKYTNIADLDALAAQTRDLPTGTCSVFRFEDISQDGDPNVPQPAPLAAGNLTLTGPKGTKSLGNVKGTFSAELGQGISIELPPGVPPLPSALFLENGPYTLTGQGGDDVGPFSVQLQLNPVQWTNAASFINIARSGGIRLTWTGGNANDPVLAIGVATGQGGKTGASFVCVAKASAGQLQVPAYILENLPASGPDDVGILGLVSMTQPKTFTARGLDLGTFDASRTAGRQVNYR